MWLIFRKSFNFHYSHDLSHSLFQIKMVLCFLENGKLFTCGENENGKLGLKDEQLENTTRPQPVATKGGHFTTVACGSGHTLALNQDGQVFSFGDGSRGQLGHGPRIQELKEPSKIQQLSQLKVKSISCGDCHSAVITGRFELLPISAVASNCIRIVLRYHCMVPYFPLSVFCIVLLTCHVTRYLTLCCLSH